MAKITTEIVQLRLPPQQPHTNIDQLPKCHQIRGLGQNQYPSRVLIKIMSTTGANTKFPKQPTSKGNSSGGRQDPWSDVI